MKRVVGKRKRVTKRKEVERVKIKVERKKRMLKIYKRYKHTTKHTNIQKIQIYKRYK